MSGADDVRERAARVRATAKVLRARSSSSIARGLEAALTRLREPESNVGHALRTALGASTGLSPAMIEWGLETTLVTADVAAMESFVARAHGASDGRVCVPPGLVALVLSGNVFTAPVRAIAQPLLLGAPVVAKASSRDDTLATFLHAALAEADAELAQSLDVLTFAGGDVRREDALFALADVVSVYGSDRTVATLRERITGTTRLVAHGHGLGLGFVTREALASEETARAAARAFAMDVAAYDQRGCLSPHAIYCEAGGHVSAERFAEWLADEGLAELATSLPRGALPTAAGAQQVQWRGVGAAHGALFEGDGYAVTFEGEGAMRLSPGYRNVAVHVSVDLEAFVTAVRPLGVHLKALGVSGSADARARVLAALPAPLAPRVSPAGTMQTPPFAAGADGELPWAGLLRYADLE